MLYSPSLRASRAMKRLEELVPKLKIDKASLLRTCLAHPDCTWPLHGLNFNHHKPPLPIFTSRLIYKTSESLQPNVGPNILLLLTLNEGATHKTAPGNRVITCRRLGVAMATVHKPFRWQVSPSNPGQPTVTRWYAT